MITRYLDADQLTYLLPILRQALDMANDQRAHAAGDRPTTAAPLLMSACCNAMCAAETMYHILAAERVDKGK